MMPGATCAMISRPGLPHGLTFAWDRLTATVSDTVHGRDREGVRLVVETCLDDAGEIWIKGTCDREWGTVPGVHGPPRVLVTTDLQPGQLSTLDWLAVNGLLGGPGGTVFVPYACLACCEADARRLVRHQGDEA